MNYYSATNELLSLPRDYSLSDAIENNDIIFYQIGNYNAEQFFQFLINFGHGIPSRIRISSFGIDGPATVSILEYKNGKLFLTIDSTRYKVSNTIQKLEGSFIGMQLIKTNNNNYIYDYTLNNYHEIFKYVIK